MAGNFTLHPNTYTFTPTNIFKIQFYPFCYLTFYTLIFHPHFEQFPIQHEFAPLPGVFPISRFLQNFGILMFMYTESFTNPLLFLQYQNE